MVRTAAYAAFAGLLLLGAGCSQTANNQPPAVSTGAQPANANGSNALELTPASETADSAVTIEIADTGYSQTRLTVKRGTMVNFVNQSSVDRWPASATHPTHEKLPSFDPRRPIPPGETFSYAFEQAGVWGFHDHLQPSIRGAITVTP